MINCFTTISLTTFLNKLYFIDEAVADKDHITLHFPFSNEVACL